MLILDLFTAKNTFLTLVIREILLTVNLDDFRMKLIWQITDCFLRGIH